MKTVSLTVLVVLVCLAGPLTAGTICPPVTPDPGITDPTGCNSVITITSGGLTISTLDLHPYEFTEDQIVGVINNLTTVVTAIPLTGSNIFGFDGDGICAGYIAASYCTSADSTGYGPNGVTFTISNANTGTVNFTGIAPGGTAFFSLEEAPSVGGISAGVPEPGTLATLGLAMFGLGIWARRRESSKRPIT